MQTYQLNQDITAYSRTLENVSIDNIFLSKIAFFYRRHQTRKQLLSLSSAQLQDIGISREEALAEAQKPFWK